MPPHPHLRLALATLTLAALACSVNFPAPTDEPGVLPTIAASLTPPPEVEGDPAVQPTTQPVLPTLTPLPAAPVITSTEEQQLIELYDRVSPSVVAILVQVGGEGVAQGTGFVFDDQGHVVT